MTTFHINRAGRAAPCEATTRACPFGEHYPSLTAAVRAAVALDLTDVARSSSRGLPDAHGTGGLPDDASAPGLPPQPTVEFGKYRGKPLAALLADRAYCTWLLTQDWLRLDYPDLHRAVRQQREVSRLRHDFHLL